MRKWQTVWLAGSLALLAGCSDREGPVSPIGREVAGPVAETDSLDGPPQLRGVAVMGTLEEVKPQEHGLVLYQTGFEFKPGQGVSTRQFRHDLPVGARHARLQVHVSDSTEIYLKGDSAKTLSDLVPGARVLVMGRVTGASVHAEMIMDLDSIGPPPDSLVDGALVQLGRRTSPFMLATTSLCMGQDLDYTGAGILEFQGCWGGPSAADDINLPFIPVFCPLIGCFGIDRFTYTLALGGWGFAFPFEFAATGPQLVYHVPAQLALEVKPLPATTGSFSFWGGIGVDFGLNFDFCSFFGCYDVGTLHLSVLSQIHQATGAGPLTGQTLEIDETSCPSIGVIPVEGIPIDPLELGFCEDFTMTGTPFHAMVRSSGATPPLSRWHGFTPDPLNVSVRPDAATVSLGYDSFAWSPDLHIGLYFQVTSFMIDLFSTPTIPIISGPFDAVTTPFPMAGSVFTVATDPLSPVDDLSYLFQPTSTAVSFSVDPAPTTLTITSGPLLAEGVPFTVRLAEAYDGAPIAGHTVTVDAAGRGGTASVTRDATTDGDGVASLLLPIGEYDITARFAGAQLYLPAQATQAPVYVYRPTTFVIWAGNPGGLAVGGQYQFWGSAWAKQVTGGAFGANSSFKGFALPISILEWVSPPASSAPAPPSVPDVIGVIVSDRISMRGANTTGNIAGHAILRVVDPAGYRPDAGHPALGVLRLTF